MGAIKILQSVMERLQNRIQLVWFLHTVAVGTGMPFHASVATAKGQEGFLFLAAELSPKVGLMCLPSLVDTPLAEKF